MSIVRVGGIDCGTNSIRLLVADADPATGALRDVERTMEIVRLGQGIDRTGVIAPDSMARTLRVARTYAARCRELGATAVRFVATSASRDASNAQEFVDGVRAAFDAEWHGPVDPEVVSGLEEAHLSFVGATGGLEAVGIRAPHLVVDLGGGSTELVRGAGTVEAARSMNIGCVRFTERYLASDPPSRDELARATDAVDEAVTEAISDVPIDGLGSLVGLAGTVTTITAHALGLETYDARRIHLARLPVADVLAASADLTAMTRAQRAALPYMHPGRVDVIGAGALIWGRIVDRVAAASGLTEVVTSEHDILDGIALSAASRAG